MRLRLAMQLRTLCHNTAIFAQLLRAWHRCGWLLHDCAPCAVPKGGILLTTLAPLEGEADSGAAGFRHVQEDNPRTGWWLDVKAISPSTRPTENQQNHKLRSYQQREQVCTAVSHALRFHARMKCAGISWAGSRRCGSTFVHGSEPTGSVCCALYKISM